VRPVAPRALSLLVSLLETSSGRIVEDTLDTSDRDAFEVLRDTGALVAGEDVPLILCPACGDQDVAPRRIGGVLQGLCPDCGYVPITNASLKAWAFDPSWLLGRLRMAFGISSRQDSEELVAGTIWKVGDYKVGRRSRRIVFARRLADQSTHDAFRRALAAKVERDNAVIISTTSRSAAMVSDVSLPFVHLAEIVHLRSGKLELDEERWAWCLKPAHLRSHADSSVFFENFRIARGRWRRISVQRAAGGGARACLHAASGGKCFKDSIMVRSDSAQKNPVELFRHNARQFAGIRPPCCLRRPRLLLAKTPVVGYRLWTLKCPASCGASSFWASKPEMRQFTPLFTPILPKVGSSISVADPLLKGTTVTTRTSPMPLAAAKRRLLREVDLAGHHTPKTANCKTPADFPAGFPSLGLDHTCRRSTSERTKR
jgi:hypothetical protein